MNKYETDFLHREIFEDRIYLKHGITLPVAPVILDVGANIGMFALFLSENFPTAQIYMVEPSPVLCAIIRANTKSFHERVTVIQAGISDHEKVAEFTFYPGYSILSGFKADAAKDGEFIRGGIRNQLAKLKLSPEKEAAFIKSLMAGKLDAPEKFAVHLTTLSTLIDRYKLERIDLLKIDAEGCELEALRGLRSEDWPKLRQIVMEVHDYDGAQSETVKQLLRDANFRVVIEQEENFRTTGITNLYAFNSDS